MTTAGAEIVHERYEVVRTLGQGAFGHTFLANDRQTARSVAIKVLDTRNRPDEKAYELFRRGVAGRAKRADPAQGNSSHGRGVRPAIGAARAER